jgi:tetratricopeptide (TPR) repeat protein
MGNALNDKGDPEAAIGSYKQALKIKPDYAEAYNNMGNALNDKGDPEAAIGSYKQALKIKPDYTESNYNLSLVYLYKMDFKKGWPKYEWRLERYKRDYTFFESEITAKSRWEPSKKGRVLLWPEQGIGDQVMFSSIIPELHKITDKLLVQVDERLIPLFKRSFSLDIEFYSSKEKIDESEYDHQISCGSLPKYFRQTIESFENSSKGWLSASDLKTKNFRSKLLSDECETLIGISWQSTTNSSSQKKSIPLSQLATSLHSNNVRLISLQYGEVDSEIENLFGDSGIKVIQIKEINNMNDIDDLAALISACDRVVSICNVTVHLAGALGKDTRVMLHYSHDWRWGKSLENSYWYSSLKLYRQTKIDDWESLISKL